MRYTVLRNLVGVTNLAVTSIEIVIQVYCLMTSPRNINKKKKIRQKTEQNSGDENVMAG